jgi:DNA-binding CsgD family transcriptional regulator
MLAPQDKIEILDKAYRCVTEPVLWPELLCQLVNATDSRSARLLMLNEDATEVLSSVKHNIDAAYHEHYVNHYVNECPWRPELSALPAGQVYSTYLHFSCKQPAFYRSRFFNEWARPQDIHHGLLGTIWQAPGACAQLLVQRTEGQGPYMEQELRAVNALIPHMRQVFRLAREFGALQESRDAVLQAASARPAPFLLLGPDGRVVHACADAEALIGQHRELRLSGGQLLCEGPSAAALRQLLREALSSSGAGWHHAGGIVRLESDGLVACISPVHPEAAFPATGTRAYAAVFLYPADRAISLCASTMARLYGFSRAESAVANTLVRGLSPREIAAERGVSFNTVRTQVAAMLRKSGCATQSDLVRTLLTGPALLRQS